MSPAQILEYATEELRSYVTAFLKGIREEFIIVLLDIAVTGGVVPAPPRAVGAALRTIGWVESNGRERPLPRIEPENAGSLEGQTADHPRGYMFQGNNFILLPAPTSGTLRLRYQQRPGQLVEVTSCAQITDIDTDTFTLTFAGIPPAFTDAVLYDMVSSTPNFVALGIDQQPFTVSPTEIVFESLPEGLAIGDWLCLAGETCIPQVPTEVFDLLAQAAAYKIAQSTGSQRAPNIKTGLDDLHKQMTQILSPRSDGSARPVISKSRIGRWTMGW